MKKTFELLQAGFQSSTGTTPEFKSFVSVFKREFKKLLQNFNATQIKINKGHFYISGFFKVDNQWFYFSLSDVRSFQAGSTHWGSLLVRTAKDAKDFTGGKNEYVVISEDMKDSFEKVLRLYV